MAGRGFAPKDPEKRQRASAATVSTELSDERVAKPPALPGSASFSAATRAWYRTWCHAPQASQFLSTDWQRLHMLAHLVERYFASPDPRVFAEIRQNEAKLGGTADDRLRLRWRMAENAGADERADRKASGSRKARGADPRLKLVGS